MRIFILTLSLGIGILFSAVIFTSVTSEARKSVRSYNPAKKKSDCKECHGRRRGVRIKTNKRVSLPYGHGRLKDKLRIMRK